MDKKSRFLPAILFFIAFTVAVGTIQGQEQTSNPRQLLSQYIAELQGNAKDNVLRERIIKLAQEIKPAPAIPEEAERRMTRGVLAMKAAKDTADFNAAVREFEQAALAAPWYADAYYNLGIACSKAEDFAKSAGSLRLYLLAAPDAKDVKEAKTLMYEMEFKQEKADKEKIDKQVAEGKKRQGEMALQKLRGTWYGMNCSVGQSVAALDRGCNEEELRGTNWHRFIMDGPIPFTFTFPGDGTVKLDAYEAWAGCGGTVWGVAQGSSLQDVRWEQRFKDGEVRQVYSEVDNSATRLKISCDRPLSGANPKIPYKYVIWNRP